jgi:hypothetical protein
MLCSDAENGVLARGLQMLHTVFDIAAACASIITAAKAEQQQQQQRDALPLQHGGRRLTAVLLTAQQ